MLSSLPFAFDSLKNHILEKKYFFVILVRILYFLIANNSSYIKVVILPLSLKENYFALHDIFLMCEKGQTVFLSW